MIVFYGFKISPLADLNCVDNFRRPPHQLISCAVDFIPMAKAQSVLTCSSVSTLFTIRILYKCEKRKATLSRPKCWYFELESARTCSPHLKLGQKSTSLNFVVCAAQIITRINGVWRNMDIFQTALSSILDSLRLPLESENKITALRAKLFYFNFQLSIFCVFF